MSAEASGQSSKGETNRFQDILKNATGNDSTSSEGKKRRGSVDFGAALGADSAIAETFRSLQENTPLPKAPFVATEAKKVIPPAAVEPADIAESPDQVEASGATPPGLDPTKGLIQITSDGPTLRLSDPRTVEQSEGPTVKPSDDQTVGQSDGQRVGHEPCLTVGQLDTKNLRLSDGRDLRQPPQTIPQTVSIDVLHLSYNQAVVLEFLIQNSAGVAVPMTNYKQIEEATKVKVPSIRDAIARLVSRGFMLRPETQRSASFQGFSYVLIKGMCDIFIAAGGVAMNRYQTIPQTVGGSDGLRPPSSSSERSKPTTTGFEGMLRGGLDLGFGPSPPMGSGPVLTGPEMGYWLEAGLKEPMAQSWCSEFNLPAEELRQQLGWARWDLVENGKEQAVTSGVVNWTYGALKRTGGCYPRPANYRTPEEIRAAAMMEEARRREKAREELRQAELELEFQTVLDDRDGAVYQMLLSKVPSNFHGFTGKMLNSALKAAFIEWKETGASDSQTV